MTVAKRQTRAALALGVPVIAPAVSVLAPVAVAAGMAPVAVAAGMATVAVAAGMATVVARVTEAVLGVAAPSVASTPRAPT